MLLLLPGYRPARLIPGLSDSYDDPKSRPSQRSGSLAPEALAGVGKLRECVAAAKNLEHLISSRDVGPKILQQVVPDVASELEPFSRTVEEVYAYVLGELHLPKESLSGLVAVARATSGQLIASLRTDAKAQFNARRRLAIERNIRSSLPPLSATLCQIELLVEATSQTPVSMSVGELLMSTPDTSSNRPHRKIILTGEVDDLIVSIPARIGIGCLSMIASTLETKGRPRAELQAHRNDGRIQLLFREMTIKDGRDAEIPVYPDSPHSMETVSAALGRFDGRLSDDKAGFSLPEH